MIDTKSFIVIFELFIPFISFYMALTLSISLVMRMSCFISSGLRWVYCIDIFSGEIRSDYSAISSDIFAGDIGDGDIVRDIGLFPM